MTQPPTSRFKTISQIVRAARQALPPEWWDHTAGGTGTETTLRRNRQMMESLAFRPSLMRGVGDPDLNTSVLGIPLRSPIMFAPVGSIQKFSPRQAVAPAAVAAKRGLLFFNGIFTSPHLSEVGAAAPGRVALQLYIRGDRAWLKDTVQQAKDSGYAAICVTVDSIGGGTRDRDLINDFIGLTETRPPNLPEGVTALGALNYQLTFTWDDFAWLRSVTDLPMLLKGITNVNDAKEAVRQGADAVYVSNHGGRGLDGLPATIEVVSEVVDAVQDAVEVVVDSGFLRGADIVKAVALGARAVLIGKLQVWSLAAGGEAGLERVVELLEQEVRETMQLLGAANVGELSRNNLRPALPTRAHVADLNHFELAPIPRL